jgi:hypothetical protein
MNADQLAGHLESCLHLAVGGATREYPHHGAPVVAGPADLQPPRALHPTFYGCFDWHSAVHAHWTMARLVRLHPELPSVPAARAILQEHIAAPRLRDEAERFAGGTAFERPYGWAWALRLEAELGLDPALRPMQEAMAPLAAALSELTRAYLLRLRWPVRAGTHANTAYALGLMHDSAALTDRDAAREALRGHALRLFEADRDWPLAYEPSGEDFLSPGLVEADLMRRALGPGAFAAWLEGFLPRLEDHPPEPIEDVAIDDGRLGHLAGLNLSRAAALRAIAEHLPDNDRRVGPMTDAAAAHLACGLGQVCSGDYAGEHWLGTFAVYALTRAWS